MIGRVVSNKMNKSAVVLVEAPKRHSLYGKRFMRSKKYLADDPFKVSIGDVVEIIKVKPISKNKHFQIKKVLGQDIVAVGTEKLKEEATQAIAEVLPEEKEPRVESQESSEEVKSQKVEVKSTSKKLKVEREVKS